MSAAGLDLLVILASQLSLILDIVLQSGQCSQYEERTGSQSENIDRHIGIRHDPKSEDGSGRQDLTYCTDTSQCQRETKSHAKSIEQGRNGRMGIRIALCSSQNDTVYNDQRNIHTQSIVQ